MKTRFWITLSVALMLFASVPAYAQDGEWTCDQGPNDILNAAQAAYDAGDLDLAYDLAAQAQTVCASNIVRSIDALTLYNTIEDERNQAKIIEGRTETFEGGTVYINQAYQPESGAAGNLDLYMPDNPVSSPLPVAIYFHGAGLSKDSHRREAIRLAQAGYAAITVEYRSPSLNGYRVMMEDAFCSVAWITTNAETYDLDPQRVIALGLSQGGGIVTVLGTVDDPAAFQSECPNPIPPAPVVSGVVDFEGAFIDPRQNEELGDVAERLAEIPPSEWRSHSDWDAEAQAIIELSPLYWIDGSEPPFLILHGTADAAVPVEDAEALAAALEAAGSEVEFELFEGMGHTSVWGSTKGKQRAMDFLTAQFGVE